MQSSYSFVKSPCCLSYSSSLTISSIFLYFSCRIDHKRNLNNIDKKELYKWVEKIQKINRDAGMFLAMCYEKYKKIEQIKQEPNQETKRETAQDVTQETKQDTAQDIKPSYRTAGIRVLPQKGWRSYISYL